MTSPEPITAGTLALAGPQPVEHLVADRTTVLLNRSRFRGTPVAWGDIVGHAPAKRELSVVAAQVRRQSVAEQLGLTLVTGVLITGPAGSGKTMLAKALASEVQRSVYVIPAAEATPQLIREVYEALASEPCIVVWDEADVLLRSRRRPLADGDSRTVAAFCSALDGVNPISGPITIALTAEDKWTLDTSALRAGRLTTHVDLALPDRGDRLALWHLYTDRIPTAGPIDLERATDRSVGMTGADIAAIVMVALGLSLIDGTDALRQDLLDEAILRRNRVDELPERPPLFVRRAAIHEAGHTLYAAVSAQRSGTEGGRTILDDAFLEGTEMDVRLIRERAAWSMAGLVAEELVYGPTATSGGSASDLTQASRLLRRLVVDLGGSAQVGPVDIDIVESGHNGERGSEGMRAIAWAEIRAESIAALASAQAALAGRVGDLERFADVLLAAEDLTLSGGQLTAALAFVTGAPA